VVARTSCFYFKGKPRDIRDVARLLGVGTVLEGSLRRSGKRLRITAQLIRAEDGCHIFSQQFDRQSEDLLDIQGEISQSIIRVLQGRLADDRQIRLLSRYGRDPEAYKLYLKGRYWFHRMLPGWHEAAIRCFEQCLEREPNLAPALTGLADCYSVFAWTGLMPAVDAMRRARDAALRALGIDDRLAEAHASLGLLLVAEYKWPEAQVSLLKALDLDPDNAMAHLWYAGGFLAAQGRLDEAHFHQKEAYKADPVNPAIAVGFAAQFIFDRQYEQSIVASKRALEIEPRYPMAYRWMGEAFLLLGGYEDAEAALAQIPLPSIAAGYLGYCHAHAGRSEQAKGLLRQLENPPGNLQPPTYQIAILQLGLGDFDAMFRSLEHACDACNFGITWLKVDPIWDPVREDPRFNLLLKRMNLR
jgi:serine/threonine-protein kinase